MKAMLAALAGLAALGCEIAPVVTSDTPGTRYSDCDRAAEAYCEHVIKASERGMDACVAEHRYKCVSSEARRSARPRA